MSHLAPSLYLLYQKASDALPGEDDDALGHIFRYQGIWNLFRHDNGNSGSIAWLVPNATPRSSFTRRGC